MTARVSGASVARLMMYTLPVWSHDVVSRGLPEDRKRPQTTADDRKQLQRRPQTTTNDRKPPQMTANKYRNDRRRPQTTPNDRKVD